LIVDFDLNKNCHNIFVVVVVVVDKSFHRIFLILAGLKIDVLSTKVVVHVD